MPTRRFHGANILAAVVLVSSNLSTASNLLPNQSDEFVSNYTYSKRLVAWLGFDAIVQALNTSFRLAGSYAPSFSRQLHVHEADHAPNITHSEALSSAHLLRGSALSSRETVNDEKLSDKAQPHHSPRSRQRQRRRLGCKWVAWKHKMVCDDPPKANAGASAPPPVTRTAVVARPRKPAAPNKPPNKKPSSPRPPLYPQKANAIKSVGNGSSSNQPRLFFNVTGERGKNGGGGSPNTPAAAVGYLPPVGMFIHIPKTGGSSIRESMSTTYQKRFPWGASYSNSKCGIKQSSTFHLTLDEMVACGLKPLPGPTLCVVRDPVSRFESEIRWRSVYFHQLKHLSPAALPGAMTKLCDSAKKYSNDDLFEHCQPQTNYLYHRGSGDATCDYLLSNPDNHAAFMRKVLRKSVSHVNKSPKKKQEWSLSQEQIAWVHRFYHRDYQDPYVMAAVKGKILRRNGKKYEEIPGLN